MAVVSKCSECGRAVETTVARDDILCINCIAGSADWGSFDEEERTMPRLARPRAAERPQPRRRALTSKL
ncbi:MAG TPA: hypothetical protein VFF06_06325 [Polyangia bacterium]|nr:hypothetical protein [Polyangia bacterium]